VTLEYDANTDTLHVTFEKPQRGKQFYHIESNDGDVYRIDEDRKVIVACTVLQFLKRSSHEDITLPEIGPVSYDPDQMLLFQPQET
jgi:hypothetical protein